MAVHAGNFLSLNDMDCPQRLFRKEVKPEAIAGRKVLFLRDKDGEIVYAHMKIWGH